jgi:hypothetical protein
MIACLDQAYAAVPPQAARLYRRLGLHPGSELDRGVVAAVADVAPVVTDPAGRLAVLVEANLLTAAGPDRHRFADAAHAHARGLA